MELFKKTFAPIVAISISVACAAQAPAYQKADSLMSEYRYADALEMYMSACGDKSGTMDPATAMNAAISAAQCDMDSLAVSFVSEALAADPSFFDERISVTELLQDCRLLPEWDTLQAENERRLAGAMTGYDIPLRSLLLEIYHSDQNPRGRLIMASKNNPDDREALGRLWKDILRNDSINALRVNELLDTYGWIPKSKVGSANQALFFVIQHSTPDVINRYIALFETAAVNGEIPRNLFAKMYDRQLMYAGKPQKYGTQSVKDAESGRMVLWRLEDPDNVNAFRKTMELPPLDDYPL